MKPTLMEVNKSFLLAYYDFFAEGDFYFPFLFWFIFFMIQVITEEIFMFFFSLLFWLRQSKIAYDSSCLSAPLCRTVLVLMYHIFIYKGFQVSNTMKN